jgi:hypothetical protein
MFIVWSLYFEILLVKHHRLDLSLILGIIIGAGMLTKTSANFAFILLPFSLLLFNFKQKNYKKKLLQLILYFIVSTVIAYAIYSVLRLSPFFYIIEQKNHLFVYTFEEWLQNPLGYVINNLTVFLSWFMQYSTIPFVVLVITSFIISQKFFKQKTLLIIWFIAPLLATAFFGKLSYPRYLLFMTMPLIPLAAYALHILVQKTKNHFLKIVIFLISITMLIIADYFILTDFKSAPIPQSDKGQFITGWPSGVGVSETVKFLEEKSKNQKIFVATQGTFGLMPYALEIYLDKNPNIEIKGYWPTGEKPPKEVIVKAGKMPVYFIFYQLCPYCQSAGLAPESWPVQKIYQVEKTEKEQFYTLYQVR